MPSERHHRLQRVTSPQGLGHAFTDVEVLIVAGCDAVEAFGEEGVPPLQYSAAVCGEDGMPTAHGFTAAVVLNEETTVQTFLKEESTIWLAIEFDGEPAAKPVAGRGA
jgi:hypothetical protein